MKFIHAADIHLDSPLAGLSAYRDSPTDLLRTATRDAFSNLVSEAISEKVDFIIIAGDLYDGKWKDYNTGVFFSREMGRLNVAGIPVFLVYGNHDAENEMTKKLSLPPNVFAFQSSKAQTHRIEHLKVALHGQSFKNAATLDNLAVGYPAPIDGWLNIGVLHTALEGFAAHASYAPCSLAELLAKKYDYWALGHVHEHAVLHTNPWVVFPGNLQGRHIRETGARGAVLVTTDEDSIVAVDRIYTDVVRWHRLEVDMAEAEDIVAAVRVVSKELVKLIESEHNGRPMVVRIILTGRSAAHGDLFGSDVQLRAEILALMVSLAGDKAWIEKVCVETIPMLDSDAIAARADAIADLNLLLDQASSDPVFVASLAEDLRALVDRTPHELAYSTPEIVAIRNDEIGSIIESVIPGLIAHLIKEA